MTDRLRSGFTCSAGVAGNKTLAKLISGRSVLTRCAARYRADASGIQEQAVRADDSAAGRRAAADGVGEADVDPGPGAQARPGALRPGADHAGGRPVPVHAGRPGRTLQRRDRPVDLGHLPRFARVSCRRRSRIVPPTWYRTGIDEDPVQEKGPPRSIMSSKTFSRALGTRQALNDWLTRLALDIFNRIEDDCNQVRPVSSLTSAVRPPLTCGVAPKFQRVPTLLNLSSRGVSRSAPIRGQDLEALHPQLVKASLDMGGHVVLPCTGVSLRVSSFTALIQPRSKIDMFFARSDPVQAPAPEEEDPAAGNEDHDQPRPFYCGKRHGAFLVGSSRRA